MSDFPCRTVRRTARGPAGPFVPGDEAKARERLSDCRAGAA